MRQFEALRPVQTEVGQLRCQNQSLEDEVAGLARSLLEAQTVSTFFFSVPLPLTLYLSLSLTHSLIFFSLSFFLLGPKISISLVMLAF